MDRPSSQTIDSVFDPWRGPGRPGGVSAVIVDGEVVHRNGFGLADLETDSNFTPSTQFHICSCTKQYTAAAILLLEHQGLLRLDDPAAKYCRLMPDVGEMVTIRHLCTNTSGLRDYLNLPMLADGQPLSRLTREMTIDLITSQRSLMFSPGSSYRYSNTNFVILGWIIESITGSPLANVFEELIFAPLQMTSTAFLTQSQPGPRGAAVGYFGDLSGGWSAPRTDIYEAGDGGVWSTLDDLIRWEINALDNMIGPKDLLARLSMPAQLRDGSLSWYAYGHGTGVHRQARWFGHAGGLSGMTVNRVHYPQRRMSVVAAGNSAQFDAEDVTFQLADLVLPGPAEETTVAPLDPKDLASQYGAYQSLDRAHTAEILLHDDRPCLRIGGAVLPLWRDARGSVVDSSRFYSLSFVGEGDHARLEIGMARGGTMSLHRLPNPNKAVGKFSGRYVSTELKSTYEIHQTDGELRLSIRGPRAEREDIPLLHIAKDTFLVSKGNKSGALSAIGPVITFEREGHGVSGLTISVSKAERNSFRRFK